MSRAEMIAKAIQAKKKSIIPENAPHDVRPDVGGHRGMVEAIMAKHMNCGGMYAAGGEVQPSKVFSGTPEEQEQKRQAWKDRWSSLAKGADSSKPTDPKSASQAAPKGYADGGMVDDDEVSSDGDWIQSNMEGKSESGDGSLAYGPDGMGDEEQSLPKLAEIMSRLRMKRMGQS